LAGTILTSITAQGGEGIWSTRFIPGCWWRQAWQRLARWFPLYGEKRIPGFFTNSSLGFSWSDMAIADGLCLFFYQVLIDV